MNASDKLQCTALHSAAAGGQAHAAKTLMEAGAQVVEGGGRGRGEGRGGYGERGGEEMEGEG